MSKYQIASLLIAGGSIVGGIGLYAVKVVRSKDQKIAALEEQINRMILRRDEESKEHHLEKMEHHKEKTHLQEEVRAGNLERKLMVREYTKMAHPFLNMMKEAHTGRPLKRKDEVRFIFNEIFQEENKDGDSLSESGAPGEDQDDDNQGKHI